MERAGAAPQSFWRMERVVVPGERPCRSRAREPRQNLAAPHSITSSARARRFEGLFQDREHERSAG